MPWDGRRQISEGVGYTTMTNHHPWLVSEFMGLLMKIGQRISDNTGIFLIVFTFMTIEILCYSFACCKIKKYTNNILIYGLSVLYFALLPAFGAFAGVVIKDGLNAALVAYFMTVFIECCFKARQKILINKRFRMVGNCCCACLHHKKKWDLFGSATVFWSCSVGDKKESSDRSFYSMF